MFYWFRREWVVLGPVMAVEVVVAAARLPSHLALEQILAGLHQQRLDLLLPATTIIPFLNLLALLPMGNFVTMDTK